MPVYLSPYFLSILAALIAVLPFRAGGQGINGPTGAQAWMMGGVSATSADVWSAANNPAAMCWLEKSQLGLYTEQRFMEKNLNLSHISGVWKNKWLHAGGQIHYFGYEVFNQQRLGLSLGKKLSENLALGVQLNYLATNIREYGNSGAWILGMGVLYKPIPKLTTAINFYNINQARYKHSINESVPTIARLGLSYEFSKKVTASIETEQTLNQKTVFRGGLRYQLHESIALAIGAANNPVYYTFGVGLKMRQLKLDMASGFHEVFGFTPHLSLAFPLN